MNVFSTDTDEKDRPLTDLRVSASDQLKLRGSSRTVGLMETYRYWHYGARRTQYAASKRLASVFQYLAPLALTFPDTGNSYFPLSHRAHKGLSIYQNTLYGKYWPMVYFVCAYLKSRYSSYKIYPVV